MATMTESSAAPDPSPSQPPSNHPTRDNSKFLDETTPFVDYVVQQALFYEKGFNEAFDSALQAFKSRVSQIRSTSSAHFHQTLDSLNDLKSEYSAYEGLVFGKIKEGVLLAASHPMITCGATAALGFLVLKRPRRFLYYNTLRLFVSEESMLSRADAQVKELRQAMDLLKAQSEKLEKRASHAEEEFLRGKTKLRQAGKHIQSVIQSAYKIERQARGLKVVLGELPKRDSSHFRYQVSKLASEVKKERSTLTKEVSKISNYGISV